MNKLAKVDNRQMEQLQDEVTELKGGNGIGTLLKFDGNKQKYFIGEDEVALTHEYIAHCDQYARGWTKFVNKVPVDMKILKVAEGKPPIRNELDERELADTDNDPWVFQRYLPLEDVETGEIVVFVSKSIGGKIALGELLDTYARNWDRGLPTVKLAIGAFNTSEYGKRPRPDFVITGWGSKAMKTIAPPDEPGPPENDPDDPGYDADFFSR